MFHGNEITAEQIELIFGQHGDSGRFANFCNTVIVAEGISGISRPPVLSEKPGPDGCFDGEWDVELSTKESAANPFAQIGWNIFQFKARGISGGGRRKAVSRLKSNLKGALAGLVSRLNRPKQPRQYVLFTSLQLGLENESNTKDEKLLSRDRNQIEAALLEGCAGIVSIEIVDAALLASLVNKHPALRLTYFSGPVARSWDEKWTEERAVKDYKTSVSLIAREQELGTVSQWIADETTRVVAMSGPPGIGKSRLALEITRDDRWRTTVVEVMEEFQRWELAAFSTSPQPQLIIVEDPDEKQAEDLAKKAVTAKGIKLIFTFPSESDAPTLKLTEHEAVKKLMLHPLTNKQSEELLSKAGATLDRNALDWIVLQAGGNPEILLSAASLGQTLREKSGNLKSTLADVYQKRIERKLGHEAVAVLRLASLLQWVKITGEKNDISAIIESFQTHITPPTILDQLKRLEQMGYVRRRGNHVMVVPPLFAAALAENVFNTQPDLICSLFDHLNDSSRKRLLERVVTTDLEEESRFWDHVFGETLGTISRLIANLDLLGYLARAAPRRAASFLVGQVEQLAPHAYALTGTLRELAYQHESCVMGMSMLQAMALREPWAKEVYSDHHATQLFCECFVHWNFDFPMSFQDREQCVRGMLDSGEVSQMRLAARVVVMATSPPTTLSGYPVTARKLGAAPSRRLLREVFNYLNNFVEMRFELTQAKDEVLARFAQDEFVEALQRLRHHLNPDCLVKHLEQLMTWSEAGKIKSDPRDLRTVIRWLQEEYGEKSAQINQAEFADKWQQVLRRVESLRQRLDDGLFIVRLQLALGREYDDEWEDINGKRVYGFEKRCCSMATEAVANPELMTDEAWGVVNDPRSYQAHVFVLALGELDIDRVFLSRFQSKVGDGRGDHMFGLYLCGIQNSSAGFVDQYLCDQVLKESFPRSAIVAAIRLVGATPGNRSRLQTLIREKGVKPNEVAEMFTTGRWLEKVPAEEIRAIVEFIASGPKEWPKWVISVLGLYLSVVKALPPELVPISLKALQNLEFRGMDEDWKWGQVAVGIAKTDLDKGLGLAVSQIRELADANSPDRELKRTRFNSSGSRDLRTFLCVNYPERTCRELLALQDQVFSFVQDLMLPFDLGKSASVLLGIASEGEGNALFLAKATSGSLKGFFPFAYTLMDAYPASSNLRSALATNAVYQTGNGVEWSFSQALNAIESEIASPRTPAHYLGWLNELKQRIEQTPPRFGFFGSDREEFLGWS
jgi:DNA-binding MarR family transcriptional regulator